jgi:hypothetical protein
VDGLPDLLACITDDRGLFFLSGCNKAFMPRWLYASCWWRHGVVLRSWISAIEIQCLASLVHFLAALRLVKKTYNKHASTKMVMAMTL